MLLYYCLAFFAFIQLCVATSTVNTYSGNSYTGTHRSWSFQNNWFSGCVNVGYRVRSYKLSLTNTGNCVVFCDGSNYAGYRCASSSNTASGSWNKFVVDYYSDYQNAGESGLAAWCGIAC